MIKWNHGTSYGYKVKKCRCDLCAKARSSINHKYYLNKGKETQRKRIHDNPERRRCESLKYRRKLKLDILIAYSGNPPKCACCGELHFEFLTVDHVNNNGNKHRKALGRPNIYDILRKNNYPLGYRILCMNCNFALGHYGYCPHSNSQL